MKHWYQARSFFLDTGRRVLAFDQNLEKQMRGGLTYYCISLPKTEERDREKKKNQRQQFRLERCLDTPLLNAFTW